MILKNENPVIVRKVSVVDTLKAIAPGSAATFSCGELGVMSSAHSVASRLNAAAGWKEFTVSSTDNGATYTVTRHERGGAS